MCNLASLTSFAFDDDKLVGLGLRGAGRVSEVVGWCGHIGVRGDRYRWVAGCSTGHDAVAQGGTFEFVAPGGKTDIFYDPPESRHRPARRAVPDLMDPAKTSSLDDFDGKVVVLNVWGQWCGPCRTEIGELQRVYDATRTAAWRSWASTCGRQLRRRGGLHQQYENRTK